MDPGHVNFAWSLNQHEFDPVMKVQNARVIACGHLKHTVKVLKSGEMLRIQMLKFLTELDSIKSRAPIIDLVVLERFMGRGAQAGLVTETANIMIGIVIDWSIRAGLGVPDLVSAAVWKNAYNRQVIKYGLLNTDYSLCAATAHQLDASLIGYHAAAKLIKIEPFSRFTDEWARDRYFQWVERSSEEPLVKRRKQRSFNRTDEL